MLVDVIKAIAAVYLLVGFIVACTIWDELERTHRAFLQTKWRFSYWTLFWPSVLLKLWRAT